MINVGNQVLGIRAAFDSCDGVLLCKGALAEGFDTVDFVKEYGEDGAAYFVQRLLYDAHNQGTISKARDGRLVSLTKF